jgi:hypothetical protein
LIVNNVKNGGNMINETLEMLNDRGPKDLIVYIRERCPEIETELDCFTLDGCDRQELLDIICDYIHPELAEFLHSDCKLEPGCITSPESKTYEELDD